MSVHNFNYEFENAEFKTGVTTPKKLMKIEATRYPMIAYGSVVPSDGVSGYSPGCIFIWTGTRTGTTTNFCNVGTGSSCDFDEMT